MEISRNEKIVVLLAALFLAGALYLFSSDGINNEIRKMNPPDTSCQIDSDCVRGSTSCSVCRCGTTCMNKNWEPICAPNLLLMGASCSTCSVGPHCGCVEGTCNPISTTS